ncbi:MAG TPA: hypothetical protein VIE46_08545, partial [Gemmatimonadales bacterium]
MTRRTVVAVIGPGEGATAFDRAAARRVGELVARAGWVTLTGGWNLGVMDAASRGARDAGGLTVGLLPGRNADGASPGVEVVIPTGLGEARNNLVVLASDALVCCGMSAGTASEAALALRVGKPLVLVAPAPETTAFLASLQRGEPIAVPDA